MEAFLDRIVNVDPEEPAGEPPADARRHRAGQAIARVVGQGLMKGVGQSRFALDKSLTRGELAAMLARFMEYRDGISR